MSVFSYFLIIWRHLVAEIESIVGAFYSTFTTVRTLEWRHSLDVFVARVKNSFNMKSISDVVQYEVICTPILTLLSRSKNSSFRPQGRKLLFLSQLSVFGPKQQCMGVHITEYCTILKSISCWNIIARALPKTASKCKKGFFTTFFPGFLECAFHPGLILKTFSKGKKIIFSLFFCNIFHL